MDKPLTSPITALPLVLSRRVTAAHLAPHLAGLPWQAVADLFDLTQCVLYIVLGYNSV